MMRTIVGHGQDWDLGDGAVAALDTTSSLVDCRQIRVHVTRVSATTGHFFSGCRNFTQSVAVRGKIGENDENVLLELVGVVFSSRESETRRNDTLNAKSL